VEAGGARRMRLTAALFAVLLAASLVSAALVVRAKTPDLMVEITSLPGQLHNPQTGEVAKHAFTPDGDGRHDVAHFDLFVRENEPHATVEIVGPFLEPVRTLARDVPLQANHVVHYSWNGDTDGGGPALPDNYRIRVILPSLDRDIVDPRRIALFRG
jgi:hypothetical protein